VLSRLTLIESDAVTGLTPWSWVVVSEQVSTENQNHSSARPIRLVAISFQWAPERRSWQLLDLARG